MASEAIRAWSIALVMMCAGCASQPSLEEYNLFDVHARGDARSMNDAAFNDLISHLRTGDIILGVKEDPITAVVRLLTVEPSFFTHSATIEVIDDEAGRSARVWHAIGDFSLFNLSPHVLGKVRGGVRTMDVREFISRYDTLAIIRLDDERKNLAMIDICRALQEQNVEFDPFADCVDESTICCTELTAIAIIRAGYDMGLVPAPRTRNLALSNFMYGWNGPTTAIYMADQFNRLSGAQTIALISKYRRMETLAAMRDAAYLLHECVADGRLQANDQVGFDAKRMVHYQPRMKLFMHGVEGLALASPTMDAAEIRRRNAIALETIFDMPRFD